jgi:uncharacterized protein
MLLGIMSDTHDNVPLVKKAIALFNERQTGHIIHAGDFTSPFILKYFKDLQHPFTGVFGNNDGDKLLLQDRSGGRLQNQPYIFTLEDRRIVVLHEHLIVDALADSGHFDLVIYGHTHEAEVRKAGKTLVINPGEVSGWLYGKSTVAIADLKTMEAAIIDL